MLLIANLKPTAVGCSDSLLLVTGAKSYYPIGTNEVVVKNPSAGFKTFMFSLRHRLRPWSALNRKYELLAFVPIGRRKVVFLTTNKAILGCAGVDGRPSGVLPMTNRLTVSRTGETGVLWCRFRGQKGNSG